MSVPISKSTTSSTLPYQPRIATSSDNINNDITGVSLNKACQFNNRNVCEVCDKLFSYKSHLKVHMRIHTGEKPYPCTECNKAFARKCTLINHMRIHTGEKLHSCTECDKAFARKYDLKTHMQVHTVEKPYSCTECDKAFARKYNLIGHMRTHIGEKPHSCTECDKAFVRKYDLIRHMRTHTGSYSCKKCYEDFTGAEGLKKHMQTHREEKFFKCTVCDKCFPRVGSLNRHVELVHQVAKFSKRNPINSNNISASLNEACQSNNRHVCKVCDKIFVRKYSLIRHMKTHTGEKPHPCTECNKAFARKYELIIHIRTHTGSYSCKKCYEDFTDAEGLKKHMQTHKGEFKCTVCNKFFPFMKRLTRHLEVDHQVAEVSKINPSNCNNIRYKMIANYHQEIQTICKNRKIKIFTKAINNMIFALRCTPEQLLTNETLNSFFYKTLLFLKHMTIPNSTATLTNMLFNSRSNLNNAFNLILDITDEQLKEIASYKYIQDISRIYWRYGVLTYEEFTLYDNFLHQSDETENNIQIKSYASALMLKNLGLSSKKLNKLSTFFTFPILKDDENNYKDKLVGNICKMLTIKNMPSEDKLTTFLNNSHIKNNNDLFFKICLMCYKKGIPDENQLKIFLENPKFKNKDNTLNYSLIEKICDVCYKKGIPDEIELNAFLDNSRFKNKDETLNYSLIVPICRMCYQQGIPDKRELNIFLDNPKFKNKDGTINYSLIVPICRVCFRKGIPKAIKLNEFLENSNFKINGTINYFLIASVCSIGYCQDIPSVEELNDFLTTIFACSSRTVKDNFILIKLLSTLIFRKGIPKKTIIADFISWLTEKKQINSEDCISMKHLFYSNIATSRFIPSKEVLEETEKKISKILKAENINLDTEFYLDDFNIKIITLYQLFKSDIINTLTEFIKFYPEKSDLYLDDFIRILYVNNFDNLSKILDLIKTSEFADKFNNLAYKKTIIQLLQIKNIKYELIKETITNVLNLPLEDMVEYALITMTSAKKINREEFLSLSKCKKNLLRKKFAPRTVDKYLNILTGFNQDDIKKYSKAEKFQIITNNMSIKCLNLLTKSVSISEIKQIFNENINYSNGDITEQTSTTMFNTALMLNECMEATAEYNHEEFKFFSATKNNTLIQLKNNNGEISNNIVLHDFLACIANNLNTEVDYTYDNKNKTLVVDSFFKEKSFVAPQLKIDKTGVIITNWSLAQTNDFFNFVYAKDEEDDDATNDVLSQKETALGKRKRSSTSTIEASSKQQKTDNSAKIPLNVIINIIQKGMLIKDSLWKTIYDYKDKLNNTCIQQLDNKYKNYTPMDFNGYFYATMNFIKEKIHDNKLNMELEAIKLVIVDDRLLDQELSNSIKKLNHKGKSKDRTFFQQISAESLELKQTNAKVTKRKLFAEKIINYLKAQNSMIFSSTEMQILDILKEYKEFVSAEIITNHIIERILICNTDSTNEWEQIIKENSVIEDSLDTFENSFVDDFNREEETVDELLDQMAFI